MNLEVLKIVYFALAQSIIQYGILIWGGAFNKHIKKLSTAQKILIKIILKKPRRYASKQTYLDAQILDVKKLYIKALLLHMFDHPELRQATQQSHATRFNSRNFVTIARHSKTNTQNFLTYTAPKTFNSLPVKIRTEINKKKYRNQIHIYLLEQYCQ